MWLYLNRAPDLNLLVMRSENWFYSVSVMVNELHKARFCALICPCLFHKSCTLIEEIQDKQWEKLEGVALTDHNLCEYQGLLYILS